MHPFRSHNCGELREDHAGETVRLSGWVHRKRDHGNLLFVDLRDPFGITQCVVDTSSPNFTAVEAARVESVLTISGPVVTRTEDTVNDAIPTGRVEVQIAELKVESRRTCCRCRSIPTKTRARISACATATSTCAARRSRATSRCART